MKQILLDGQPFTYGDSLEMIAAMGIDIGRLSFAPEDVETMKTRLHETARRWMDSGAQGHRYKDLLTLCSYANSKVARFRAEGEAGLEWRDQCRLAVERIIEESKADTRTAPTDEELIARLPELKWPEKSSEVVEA